MAVQHVSRQVGTGAVGGAVHLALVVGHPAAHVVAQITQPALGAFLRENAGQAELWCVAGRSMFLDGGLRLLRLDPVTGKKIHEKILDDRVPDTNDNLQIGIKGYHCLSPGQFKTGVKGSALPAIFV